MYGNPLVHTLLISVPIAQENLMPWVATVGLNLLSSFYLQPAPSLAGAAKSLPAKLHYLLFAGRVKINKIIGF